MICGLVLFTEIFLCILKGEKKPPSQRAPAENTALEMLLKNGLALTIPSLDVERGKPMELLWLFYRDVSEKMLRSLHHCVCLK